MLKTPDFYVFLHFSVPQDPPQGPKNFSKKKFFFSDFAKVKCDCENDPQNRGSSNFPFFPFFPFPLRENKLLVCVRVGTSPRKTQAGRQKKVCFKKKFFSNCPSFLE